MSKAPHKKEAIWRPFAAKLSGKRVRQSAQKCCFCRFFSQLPQYAWHKLQALIEHRPSPHYAVPRSKHLGRRSARVKHIQRASMKLSSMRAQAGAHQRPPRGLNRECIGRRTAAVCRAQQAQPGERSCRDQRLLEQ